VRFTGSAVLRRFEGVQLNDETSGGVIAYNNANDTFTVDGGPASSTPTNPSGRVRAMLTPVNKGGAESPPAAAPAPLKPSGRLGEGAQ
jgi:lipopolysaccharide export system protein LptA